MNVRKDSHEKDDSTEVLSPVSVINMQFRGLKKLAFDCNVPGACMSLQLSKQAIVKAREATYPSIRTVRRAFIDV